MKNKNILTTILVIALLSIFLIKSTNNNFFKMNSKYKLQSFNAFFKLRINFSCEEKWDFSN